MNQIDRCRVSEDATATICGEPTHVISLRHGGIAEARIRFELAGPEGAPLIIVAGGISAGRHVISNEAVPEAGWWQSQQAVLATCRLLAIDWIGADGSIDLPIDAADQAEAIARLLDELGEPGAAAFIGASYGGMVGMHFAGRYPHRLGRLLAISAAAAAHPFATACRAMQRQAIALGERHGDAASGVALARAMAMLTYRTPGEFAERFDSEPVLDGSRFRFAAEPYLDAQGQRHSARMRSIAYRRLSESIDLHRIDPSDIKVPLTLVAVDQDSLVPAADIHSLAAAVPGSRCHLIHSRFGHDAFLKEETQVAAIISQFLETLEPKQ